MLKLIPDECRFAFVYLQTRVEDLGEAERAKYWHTVYKD